VVDSVVSAPSIDAGTLREWLASGQDVKVIDVRTPAEFEAVHIPGSYNVPLDTLEEHRDEIRRHLSESVVLVCRSGGRAAQAERKFAEVGMPNVHVLEGGITAWHQASAPVRTGRARWDLERQVRLVAGALVFGGVLASVAFEPAKWLAGAVGAGLAVAALTNTCAMGLLLSKLPYNRGATCDVNAVVAELTGTGRRAAGAEA
jgi:rhodanese-related sulfurtransferase